MFEVIRDARDDNALLEEQRAFEQQRALVVKEVLPPARRDEFGQDDGDDVVGVFSRKTMNVSQQRACELAIRRR